RRDGQRHRHRGDKGEQTMTVTAVRKDPERLTLTIEAEFDASAERVWQLWADPRQLERWWGPPTYPATFTKYDLAPGGRVEFYMTWPAGDQPHGHWDVSENGIATMKLRNDTQVSVDGVVKANGGRNEDFDAGMERGGWARPLFDSESMAFVNEFYQQADAFLFGRRTYELFAGYWGVMDPGSGPIADALNSRPKYVASNTLTDP